jgi:ribosomal protein L3 glutamine methyltransferase
VLALARTAERRLREAHVAFGHGTTNAWDEAVYLVLHALRLPLDDLAGVARRPVAASERAAVERLLEARIRRRVPAAYLTREAWLGDHRFEVDRRTIVPRSFIAEVLRAAAAPGLPALPRVRHALDLCTGSGCLAILVALACPRATVDAADLSAPALAVARRNVAAYRLGKRIRLARSDLFHALRGRRYDLIVSNPPYVTDAAMARLPPEHRREPRLALAGGADGLDCIRRILAEAPEHLAPEGVLVLEVGHARARVEKAFPELVARWAMTSGGDDCVLIANRAALTRALPAPVPAAPAAPARRASRGARSPRRVTARRTVPA